MMSKQVIYHVTPKEYLLWALSGEEIVCQDCDGLGYNIIPTGLGGKYLGLCLTCDRQGTMTPAQARKAGVIVVTDGE